MTNSVPSVSGDPMQAFRDRVLAKLRADIGDMLPDEALAGLVQQAVQDQFFKTRKEVTGDRWNERTVDKPSWFVEEVGRIATPMIEAHVAAYVKDNREVIAKAVKDFLDAQNLTLLTVAAMRQVTFNDVHELAGAIVQRMKQGY